MATQLKEAGGDKAPATVQAFIVNLAMALIDDRSFEDDEWVNTLTVPYLSAHMPEGDAKKAGQAFVEACRKEVCSFAVTPACTRGTWLNMHRLMCSGTVLLVAPGAACKLEAI